MSPKIPDTNECDVLWNLDSGDTDLEVETMLSKCINYFQMQEKSNTSQVLSLHGIGNLAAAKAQAKNKQEFRRIILDENRYHIFIL